MKPGRVLVGVVLTVLLGVQLSTASDDIEALIASCSETVEGLTDDLKDRYRANQYPDDPVTRCFVRCLAVTLNLYDDERGVDLRANWEHLGRVTDEDAFVAEHRTCLDGRQLDSTEDPCDKAYSAFQCFKEEYGIEADDNATDD